MIRNKISLHLLLVLSFLLICSSPSKGEESAKYVIEALSNLLKRSNEDSFVIFEDSSTRKYIQFAKHEERIWYDIPIYAEGVKLQNESISSYSNIDNKPKLDNSTIERYLSISEEKDMLNHLKNWGLNHSISYVGSYNSSGEIVKYFAVFDGFLTLKPEEYDDFVLEAFENVYKLHKDRLKLRIIEN